jgi:hypothetical protein
MEKDGNLGDTAATARLLSLCRALLAKGGALQSTNSGEQIDRAQLTKALESRIQRNLAAASAPLSASAVAAEALTNAQNALNKTAGGASPANLTDLEIASLEAIIEETGRPAMRYLNGGVQMPPSELGENDRWRVLIAIARSRINRASASVGGISMIGSAGLPEHIGTGWCAAGGLIVTNRHVVLDLIKEKNRPVGDWALDAAKRPVIDFTATDQAATTQRFEIAGIAHCVEDEKIDMAFLRLNASPEMLPPSLALDWDPSNLGSEQEKDNEGRPQFHGAEVYVVGHPYKRYGSELIASVFGVADGSKRWSPGLVTRMGAEEPFIEHDCSTLSGNSGACVLTAERHEVVGVHIGGDRVDEATGRGRANLAIALSRLGSHNVVELLRSGRF